MGKGEDKNTVFYYHIIKFFKYKYNYITPSATFILEIVIYVTGINLPILCLKLVVLNIKAKVHHGVYSRCMRIVCVKPIVCIILD